MKLNRLFFYCGPNRRSDKTMIEAVLGFEPTEANLITEDWSAAVAHMQVALTGVGVTVETSLLRHPSTPAGAFSCFCELHGRLALGLQKHCGHAVHDLDCREGNNPQTWLSLFEHEETSVGEQSAILALSLLDQSFPRLETDLGSRATGQAFEAAFRQFEIRARSLVQPADTAAFVAAARRAGVPVVKLERDPYEPVQGDFRIRMNSMLMLGHCNHRQIIDGSFALEKSAGAAPLLNDLVNIREAARQLGMPVPRGPERPLISLQRATRFAGEIGFPVTVRPVLRSGNPVDTENIKHPEGLALAITKAQVNDEKFFVEQTVAGQAWTILVADHNILCVVNERNTDVYEGPLHPTIDHMVCQASRSLNVGLLAVSVISADLTCSLAESGGVVTMLQVAPRLDTLLNGNPRLLDRAAEAFIHWLVPSGPGSAIPIIAVTGTNGKTTTCRMIDHILRKAGHSTGMQCTDGRYLNGELLDAGDSSSLMGHLRIFEDRSVQTAVLETHHRGIAVYGFAFEFCNVAICSNVTDDHIGTLGVETVSDMAIMKRSLLERARDCAVLNADDPHCLAMLPHLSSHRTCLTSLSKTPRELAQLTSRPAFFCVLEIIDGEQWVVIYDEGQLLKVIRVRDIPASFEGLARFNVSNAAQAIAGCHAMGIDMQAIRTAMQSFVMSVESTPGRLNFYTGLPFQILVDFAHNPDGMRRIAEFTDGIEVPGRKIVAFSGFRANSVVIAITREIAGHFDRYVLKNYGIPEGTVVKEGRDPWRCPNLMKTTLLEYGISDRQISVELDEMTAVEITLDMARAGDLVVILLGYTGMAVIKDFMSEYIARRS